MKAILVAIRFFMAVAGIILCMCDVKDLQLQVLVGLAGLVLFVLAILPGILNDYEEGLGSLYE